MLKIHICQDEDHPEISSPPDNESCETAIRLLTGMLIYTVKSSKSDHRRRNNRALKFGQIWYFLKRNRDYIFNFLDVGANIFHDRMELYNITEESWKFQLNLTPEFGKALYQA